MRTRIAIAAAALASLALAACGGSPTTNPGATTAPVATTAPAATAAATTAPAATTGVMTGTTTTGVMTGTMTTGVMTGATTTGVMTSTTTTGTSEPATTGTSVVSGTATTGTPGASMGGAGAGADTVVGLLSSDPRFTTLSAALRATNLEQTLGQAGPFTVFAPTDQAFSSLPAGTLQGLLADPSKLTSILSYHVAQGKLTPSDLSSAQTIPTVEGNAIGVSRQGAEVLLNGTTRVTATQLETGNGVVYVIDKVLLPPNINLPAGG